MLIKHSFGCLLFEASMPPPMWLGMSGGFPEGRPRTLGRAVKANKHGSDALLNDRAWPVDVLQVSNNYKSQFEMPVLFFAAIATALAIHAATVVLVWLAWGFVAARLVHSVCYCGSNRLPVRFASFFASVVAVTIMWAMLASHVFSTGTT